MKKRDFIKSMQDMDQKMSMDNRQSDFSRARSITVGTCFNGVTEIMMRGNDGNILWVPMQPVEVVEFITQLAGNIGCHVGLRPRDDFASWRNWKVTPEEKQNLNGFPPFAAGILDAATILPLPENQPGLNVKPTFKGEQHEQTVATKKAVNRRSTKRTAKAS